jgi:hypothetical protein
MGRSLRTSKSIVTEMVRRGDAKDQVDLVNDLLEINELDLEGGSTKSDDNAPKKKNLLKTTLLS